MSRKTEEQQAEYVLLLKSMFDFLRNSGVQEKRIRRIVDLAFEESGRRTRRVLRRGDFGIATAGRVLDRWHRSRKYTTEAAAPRAIRLLGHAPSVEALVRSENARVDCATFARRLKTLRLVVRAECGRY